MLETLKDTFTSIGDNSGDYARRFGGKTVELARRVGPKRGVIALVVIAAAIAGAVVVRHLRTRDAAVDGELTDDTARTKKQPRRARNNVGHAHTAT